MFKIIAALALCLVVSQASNVDLKPKLTNEAKDLYDKLLQVIGSAITEANSTCNDALNAAKQYSLEIEAAAKTEIQGALDSFQAQLDELNKKAKDAGIDISECRKYEVQFSQLPDTFMDEIVACINNQITNGQNQINDAMNRAMAIQQDFSNIGKEIDDCGSGWKSIACLAKLVTKIEEDAVEGPAKIKTDVDNTVEIIKNAWPEIKQCATSATENVPSQAGNIVKDFAICAAIP